MPVFKDHKININHLLGFIPEALIAHLSAATKVDHYTKVLHGKKMFYLLMYGILENDRLSQRTLEDSFNDPVFKVLFNLDEGETVRRSSISDRLSKMEPDYFRQLYECIYDQFSELYSSAEKEKYNLIRVDSSMVSETVGKLLEGIDNKSGKKAVKYSIAFDGMLPCHSDVFTAAGYASEDIALPEAIMGHVKKDDGHRNIYVMDRGLQSTRAMKAFNDQKVTFIARAKENRKFVELESFIGANQDLDLGESTLVKDCKIQLYTGLTIHNKRGNKHSREVLSEGHFRLVIVESKAGTGKTFWFLTNDFECSAKEIAHAYRRRWDIEIFFRFLKTGIECKPLGFLKQEPHTAHAIHDFNHGHDDSDVQKGQQHRLQNRETKILNGGKGPGYCHDRGPLRRKSRPVFQDIKNGRNFFRP